MADYCMPGEINSYVPKASTQVTIGDVLVTPRRRDPFSRARLGATVDRALPIASADSARWSVGIAAQSWNAELNGTTNALYAAPTDGSAIKTYRTGIFKLKIRDTAGYAGDYVRYVTGATGAQIFIIDNYRPGNAVGRIFKAFSGATANDEQYVELIAKPLDGLDYYYWLENRVVSGCKVIMHSANAQKSSQVAVGLTITHTGNAFVLQNKYLLQGKLREITRQTDLSVGRRFHLSAGASRAKFYWVMGRSASIAIRTCSGKSPVITSFSVSGNTMGAMVPLTYTSGEVAVALLCAFSATKSLRATLIANKPGMSVPKIGSWRI